MSWQDTLRGDTLTWLMEYPDAGVRYLALRDLCGDHENDPELITAREQAHAEGPIARILDVMHPDGYWSEPGSGYNPKYFSAVWSIILLAQLGARAEMDPRISQACACYLDHAFSPGGQIGTSGAPSQTVDCLQGNMLYALQRLGYSDSRLEKAYEWMARTVTGEGVAPAGTRDAPVRYYAGKCGPLFACGANDKQPCAWGAAKVMLALGALSSHQQQPLIQRAVDIGINFLFSVDPADAAYPSGYSAKPSGNWWKFGFPVFYVTDLLQIAEALAGLGYAHDPRLQRTIEIIRNKQDQNGRWALEYDYKGKTWVDFGQKKKPNPWVTLRALRFLKAAL